MRKKGLVVNPPVGRKKTPQPIENPNTDFYFFPFFASTGMEDAGSEVATSGERWNAVINGKKPITLLWLNSLLNVEFDVDDLADVTQATKFVRKAQIGTYFTGRVIQASGNNVFNEKSTGFKTIQGDDVNTIESHVEATITLVTKTDFFFIENTTEIEPNLVRLFFVCPELFGQKVFFINDIRPEFNTSQGVNHLEITLSSLNDKLEKIGTSVRSYLTFSAPGEGFPFPEVKNDQPTNETLFFDSEISVKEKTKRIYLRADLWQDKPVHSFSLEFFGAAMLNSISFFGRPVTADEATDTNVAKTSRMRQLFLLHDTDFSQTQRESYDVASIKKYAIIHGAPFNENWYDDWQADLGLFFDPNKTRNTQAVFSSLVDDDDEYLGTTIEEGQLLTAQDATFIFGRYLLATNQYSQYLLNPTAAETTTVPKDYTLNGEEYSDNKVRSIADFLNTNAMYQFGQSYLETAGVKTKNRKGFWASIASGAAQIGGSILGTIIGARKGGGTGSFVGAQIGSQSGNVVNEIFKWLPNSWFTDTTIYKPPYLTSFLVPERLLQDFDARWEQIAPAISESNSLALRTYRRKRIPLEFFMTERENYLSPLLNGLLYRPSFKSRITDTFKLNNVGDKINGLQFMNGEFGGRGVSTFYNDEIITGVESNTDNVVGYVIDAVIIRALTTMPFRITFYDSQGQVLWEATRSPQSGYTGDTLEWETVLPLSRIKDNNNFFDNPNYKYEEFLPKQGQAVNVLNVQAEQKKARADLYLTNLAEIELETAGYTSFLFNNLLQNVEPSEFTYFDDNWVKNWFTAPWIANRDNWASGQIKTAQHNWTIPPAIKEYVQEYYYDQNIDWNEFEYLTRLRDKWGFNFCQIDPDWSFTMQGTNSQPYIAVEDRQYFLSTARIDPRFVGRTQAVEKFNLSSIDTANDKSVIEKRIPPFKSLKTNLHTNYAHSLPYWAGGFLEYFKAKKNHWIQPYHRVSSTEHPISYDMRLGVISDKSKIYTDTYLYNFEIAIQPGGAFTGAGTENPWRVWDRHARIRALARSCRLTKA